MVEGFALTNPSGMISMNDVLVSAGAIISGLVLYRQKAKDEVIKNLQEEIKYLREELKQKRSDK